MNKRPILVAFSNQKGGVGKSTVTAVLASYFLTSSMRHPN